jgi:outer membrane protein assembly factor BamB
MSAPTVSEQTLYITAGYNDDSLGDTLYALDSDTGKLLREVQLTGAVTRPIIIDHDIIYYSSQNLNIPAFWVGAIR